MRTLDDALRSFCISTDKLIFGGVAYYARYRVYMRTLDDALRSFCISSDKLYLF